MRSAQATLRAIFRTLRKLWGPQHWWPAESQFEVIVGAYLTQNTAWTNVERAMANLRVANALSLAAIREIPLAKLEELVRPSGYFRQKAERLKRFVAFVDERYDGSLERMFSEPTPKLRAELLALNGIGPETADSILLYGGGHEVFVVDTYTRRVLDRHAILPANAPYEEIRELFEASFGATECGKQAAVPNAGCWMPNAVYGAAHPPSYASQMLRSPRAQVLNEMHAMIVGIGKNYCLKTAPLCEVCPLRKYLPGR
jgi:endonuclease III related protein